jgi:hypothetical protein
MSLVKYFAGDYDLACNPKECSAVVISTGTKNISVRELDGNGKKTVVEKTIKVATLSVFQANGQPVLREDVPHVDNKIEGLGTVELPEGQSRKEVHAYYAEA